MKTILISFSPLRYWGGLYPNILSTFSPEIVLVPFDIGVVYIGKIDEAHAKLSFSPLRYWGGLYQKLFPGREHKQF